MEKWKNQSIIEVRNLINKAQQDYSQLLFEDAENQLLKAQDLSNEINPAEPDQEIIIWLDIVRSALSARSSREIKEEEVNYAEMTQLFNLANKDYSDGVAALKNGDKENADRLFQSARDKIALIKRSYPYHRDSRVLLYKIERATRSKADFDAYLQVQVNNADQLVNKNNYLEAYAIYQDIQEIDPRYPGINAKVRRAEELIGIRARQPSQADQARSAELVRLAQESSANKEYQTAIGYLTDALRLNPFNRSAAVLKDRINEIIAPPSSILPVEAQELYNSAVVSYNNKEYLRARQLLSQIKRDFPQQARNSKVVELEEKIKSRIGSRSSVYVHFFPLPCAHRPSIGKAPP
jgi:tetratricopeptide (TPR) repeat protein